MKNIQISFKDILFYKISYLECRPFVNYLELAMVNRCFLAFQYLLENGVEPERVTSSAVRNLKSAKERRLMSAKKERPTTSRARSAVKHVDLSLERIREKAEILEIYEIIDILDNYGENAEIIAASNARNDLISAKKYKTVSATYSAKSEKKTNSSFSKKSASSAGRTSVLSNFCLII